MPFNTPQNLNPLEGIYQTLTGRKKREFAGILNFANASLTLTFVHIHSPLAWVLTCKAPLRSIRQNQLRFLGSELSIDASLDVIFNILGLLPFSGVTLAFKFTKSMIVHW